MLTPYFYGVSVFGSPLKNPVTYVSRQISFLNVLLSIIMMVAVGALVGCVGTQQRQSDEALVESYASADANPKNAEITKLN